MIRSILTKLKMRLRGEIPTETYVKNGMRIGRNFHRLPNCTFDISHCWLISIGDNVTCAPGVRIIAHDASSYEGFVEKHLKYQSEKPCFSKEYTIHKGVSIWKKQEMREALNQYGFGYVE